MALWILPDFMKETLCAIFNNPPVPFGIGGDAYEWPKKEDGKIVAYVELVNHLLKSYATNISTAKATSEIGQLMKPENKSAV